MFKMSGEEIKYFRKKWNELLELAPKYGFIEKI